MGRFSGGTLTRWAGSSRTVPSSTTRPPVSGSRPIRARRVVDFPEPFGPSRASTSPDATVNAVSRLSLDSRSWMSASSMAVSPPPAIRRLKIMTTRLTTTSTRLSAIASSIWPELWLM